MVNLPSVSPPSAALLPRPCRVLAVERETADTWTLSVEAPPGFAFRPGQFNMLYAFGIGEVPISLSGDPGEPERLIHSIRAVGPVTEALCALRPGASLGVRGPFGSAWPVREHRGRDLLFLAGGIGIAPLRPAIYQALEARDDFGRVIVLIGSRRPEDRLYADELARWSPRLELMQTVDAGGADWRGPVGLITGLLPRVDLRGADAAAFICGPEVMMRFCAARLAELGLAPERTYVSLERNMKCAVATCGHCQLAGSFVCKDGPVYPYPKIAGLIPVREL